MRHSTTIGARTLRRLSWPGALFAASLAISPVLQAQVVFNETFTGGVSSEGFTVEQNVGTCTWAYNNPGARTITGAGFDADFAIFDSDICGSGGGDAEAVLVSPPFDASTGNFLLSFDQQYRSLSGTTAAVEVWNGSQWTQVYSPTGANVGYPGPAVNTSVNITGAAGGATNAQVRFLYAGSWQWWWAVDNISLEAVACVYPSDLAVSNITTEGASFSWTDNGSSAYEWAVTTGAEPDGTNEIASGDGSSTDITGLSSGSLYSVFVRSDCDGTFSPWSPGVNFTTGISNDECADATTVPVNPNYDCELTVAGTIAGATGSGVTSSCFGTADDDVWYTFTATDTLVRIRLLNLTGSTTDMYMAVWQGDCGNLTLVPNSCSDPETLNLGGLQVDSTYFLQVYSYTSLPGQTSAFDVCIGTAPTSADSYCTSLDFQFDVEPICNVNFAGIDNASPSEVNGSPALEDFTSLTAIVDAGSTYPITVSGNTNGPYTTYVTAFFDWDQNNIFETAVNIGSFTNTVCTIDITADVVVPAGALSGTSRMRVVKNYNAYATDPCGSYNYGQGEDYTVEVSGGSATYCDSISYAYDVEPICNVTFAGIDNTSDSELNGTPALEDFTAIAPAMVMQGQSYPISITGNTGGNWSDYVTAFFDWNQDGTFETAVELGAITNDVCSTALTGTIDVPADAVLGNTRMRIVKNYDESPLDPCGAYDYGQAEDYTVQVDLSIGIAQANTISLGLAPNPAHDRITLINPSGKATQAIVYDMVGNLVLKTGNVADINISSLTTGSYILVAQDANGAKLAHLRFVKQ